MLATVQNSLDLAWKELQIMLKDRGLLAGLFLLPLLFGAMFSLSQQGALDEATGAATISVDVYVVVKESGQRLSSSHPISAPISRLMSNRQWKL